MKRAFFLSLLILSPAHAIDLSGLFGKKPITIGIAVDMTGAQKYPGYSKTARLVVESTLSELKHGDTVTLYKTCDHVATIASYKVPKAHPVEKISDLARKITEPCKGKGSTITRATKKLHGHQFSIMFTDGGIGDDPERAGFKKAAAQLVGKNAKAVWFVGLSSQKAGRSSLRDVFAEKLPRSEKIILSGLSDAQGGFSQLIQRMKAARK